MGSIKPKNNTVVVELTPQELLTKPIFDRDGSRMAKTGLNFYHAIQGYAFVALYNKAPKLFKKFKTSTVDFKDGRFVITFADSLDDLLSDVGGK